MVRAGSRRRGRRVDACADPAPGGKQNKSYRVLKYHTVYLQL